MKFRLVNNENLSIIISGAPNDCFLQKICSETVNFFLLLAGSPLQFETRQFSTLKKGSRETKTTKLGVQTRVLFQIESSSV